MQITNIHQDERPRVGGQWRGRMKMAAAFDQLPAGLERLFRGED